MKQYKTNKVALTYLVLSIGLIFLSWAQKSSYAAVTPAFSYQGQLTDAARNPLANVTRNMTFSIYDVPSGLNAPLKTPQTILVTTNSNGIFSVLIDTGTLAFDGPVYYLGVQVDLDQEMSPRKQLVSVPQALNANNANNLIGDGYIDITGGAAIGGAVGIGTSNPNYQLEVIGPATGTAARFSDNINGSLEVRFPAWDVTDLFSDSVNLSFTNQSGEVMRLQNENVGIGTVNPLAKLQVAGASILSDSTVINPNDFPSSVLAGMINDGSTWGALGIGGNYMAGSAWGIGIGGTGHLHFGMQDGTVGGPMDTYIEFSPNRDIYLAQNAGRVGVGTNSPNNLIQVAGLINFDNALSSTSLGYQAGNSNVGTGNFFGGYYAGFENTSGSNNVAVGLAALQHNDSGSLNTAVGVASMENNETGQENIGIGPWALQYNQNGNYNVAMGPASLLYGNGNNNVGIGYRSGQNASGSGNVFLGFNAGFNAMGSNKLFIENSDSSSPLIYGEFANDLLTLNGSVGVGDTPSGKFDILAELSLGGSGRHIQVSGGYAYIAEAGVGLIIVNVSDATNPIVVGSYSNPGASGVVLSGDGNYAYLADADGLEIIDISDPANPTPTDNATGTGQSSDVALSTDGNYAYVMKGTIDVFDVNNPLVTPSLVTNVVTVGSANGGTVAGDYLYVADFWGGLVIYDITIPGSPSLIGQQNTNGGNAAYGVIVSGDYAYVGVDWGGVEIFDVSVKSNPVYLSTFSIPGYSVWDLAISGTTLYVPFGSFSDGILATVDVSDPNNPVEIERAPNSTLVGIAIQGNYAYTTDYYSGVLSVFDISLEVDKRNLYVRDNLKVGQTVFTNNLSASGDAYFSGNLGIGIIAPSTKLQVRLVDGVLSPIWDPNAVAVFDNPGSNAVNLHLNARDTQQLENFYFSINGNMESGIRYNIQNDYLGLFVDGDSIDTEQFVLRNGNVGIGTVNPTDFALQVVGDIGPDLDNTYSLGSSGKRWQDLYVGPSSIHIGEDGDEGVISYNTVTKQIEFSTTGGVELGQRGISWTAQSAAEANSWKSIAYGNGLFVAVSQGGTNQVMTSPDGVNWTARSAPTGNWLSVTYGNGLFVAVGNNGVNYVMTSPDGIAWTLRTAAENNTWYSVTYGDGLFVAVALSGTHQVMTSADGVNWIARTAAENNVWGSVAYGNGRFVAVSDSGTNRVMTSTDGITWSPYGVANGVGVGNWDAVTYGNGQFVAVAYGGTDQIMTSSDGMNWVVRSTPEANPWISVAYGEGLFVAVAGSSGTHRVMTSPDGINWAVRDAAENNWWTSVAYGNGIFAAVAYSGTHQVMTSGKPEFNSIGTNNTYQGGMNIFGNVGIGTVNPTNFALQVVGDVGPDTDNTYSLGSSSTRWKDVYVGPGSVHLGNSGNEAIISYNAVTQKIEFDAAGGLDIGPIMTDSLVVSPGNLLTGAVGFNNYLNVSGSIGTGNIPRITNSGNLTNIGSIQAGEMNLTRGGTFAAKVDYAAGTNSERVAMGDLNGDGKADLAVTNSNSNTVSVFLNNGTGAFAPKVDYATGLFPSGLAMGDLNGDGKADLAVTDYSSNRVSIFLNNGAGIFATKVDYVTGIGPWSVAVGDLNGDGKADLSVANYSANTVSILLNNGDGTFTTKVDYVAGSGSNGVALGDLNGDGMADLAVTDSTSSRVSIFLNNGDGTFATKVDYVAGSGPGSVAIGDLNGDGKADLAVSNYNSNNVSVFLNNGTGTFATKVDYATGIWAYGVAMGDLNGDGRTDLAVTNESPNTVSVLINSGTGTFAAKVDYATGATPRSVALGDLNGDGKADLAAACSSGVVSVLLNQSSSMLYAQASTGNVGIGTTSPITQLHVPGSLPTSALGSVLTGSSYSMYAQGDFAYVIDESAGRLVVVSVSNPAAPTIKGTISIASPKAVFVQGKYAYVVSTTSLHVIDVSNPSAPASIGSVSHGGSVGSYTALYIRGTYAYLESGTGNFNIFDISNPTNPTLTGTLGSLNMLYDVHVKDKYAITVGSDNILRVIDISNPASPTQTGSVATSSLPYGLDVQGNYAYVACYGAQRLDIVDISNPASPTVVSSTASSRLSDVVAQGRYVYASSDGSSRVYVYDVSSPSSPVSSGVITTASGPNSVSVSGRYMYVTSRSGNVLQVFDIGGAYVQQLEVGGGKFGSLQVNASATINSDLDVRGGTTFGRGFMSTGTSSIYGNEYIFGNLGIGTASPAVQLHTTGAVRFQTFGAGTLQTDASGNLSVSSDERLKDVQGYFSRGLDAIVNINPISYRWNSESGMETANVYSGFSAQNVQDWIPEAVGQGSNGFLTLSDRPILGVLVNSVKELHTQDTLVAQDIDDLNLKTDQNITTVNELQISIDQQLGVVSQSLNDQSTLIDQQGALIAALQQQMIELQGKLNAETNLAQIDLNKQDIGLLKQILGIDDRVTSPGDIDLLGKLSAETVETGGLVINIVDSAAATIGQAIITPVTIDMDLDGVDDVTGSNGKSVVVATKAVADASRLFVTPVGETPVSWIVSEVQAGVGFTVTLEKITDKSVNFNWWIVDSHLQ